MAKLQDNKTPPINDEATETKLISLALRQVEEQLQSGTASAQVLTHLLRLASQRSTIELEQLKLQNRLLEEKIEAEKSGQRLNEMFQEVLAALKSYTYVPPGSDDVELF